MIWTVRATVTKIHDGDTLTADLDLGWKITLAGQPVRLARCNAPELATVDGRQALAYLQTLVRVGDLVTVVSTRLDKYGRVLGEVTTETGIDLADAMIAAGHAKPWDGTGVKPT
jgi:endonuclease YncB( thermonuclease family)